MVNYGLNNNAQKIGSVRTPAVREMKNGTDNLNTADSIWIAQLAYSCPFVNGYGVYKARTLLKLIGSFDNPNDKNLCNASGMYKMNSEENEPFINLSNQETELVKVYPNPFNDIVTIEYDFNANEDATIFVYDIVGNIILSDKLDYKYKIKTLNLRQQASGIYFYKLSTPFGKNFTGKLIKE